MRLLRTYRRPVKLELITSILLIISTISALLIYNSPLRSVYKHIFNDFYITTNFSLHMFINDFLMAVFFLVAGLEIKYELLHGNLSSFKKASFPVIASIGGVIVPAIIFFIFNKNTPFLYGICIPISTDIAFAVGVYFIFRKKLNPNLKVFLLSLAVVDDLISIAAIGLIYSIDINFTYLSIAFFILIILFLANNVFKIESVTYYLISGLCLWYFVHLSGVHSTISGILLSIIIPSTSSSCNLNCLEKLQRLLVPINSILIIPIFAFANTGISLSYNLDFTSALSLSLGIILGLCIGKPVGIMLFSFISCFLGITEKPYYISWMSVFLVSLIAGIGFTMSIFISEIAFIHDAALINIAKMSILISSIISILSTTIVITLCDIFKKTTSNKSHVS
ncbi:Na+/H+ antiporter NhaA [Romboutsia maritimum]|uniref:Na(+)/H(+) antiporter NhaA n=1 Tax=Romboutsia maritimum TaxID=2020948 RepID=A0A371ISM1_9FIRM|nr:Na+/H+ antiporter NhaA [Romboutsia maritimum]RDY23486.1 Na+/H+ antiporter NhaA [Romboutsia maritimum]